MYKQALTAGIFFAGLAVITGAFGAHALKDMLHDDKGQLLVFETGVRYQFYHGIALLITGILYSGFPFKAVRVASGLFITGIVLFSGSLYAMVLLSIVNKSIGLVGILTPIGGLFFIAGWVALLMGVMKKK